MMNKYTTYVVIVVMVLMASSKNVPDSCHGDDLNCYDCGWETLNEWLKCLTLSTKYNCFLNEGITEVKDLLLFKSPISSIHLQDLEILRTKCDLNSFQFVKLKRNIELLDQMQSSEKTSQHSNRYIDTEFVQYEQYNNSGTDLCDISYAFTPVILTTFYHAKTEKADDMAMVPVELVGILSTDSLTCFTNVRVNINMIGFDDMKYNITFDDYSFENRWSDNRLITFKTEILNSTAHKL
eukprot:352326_1